MKTSTNNSQSIDLNSAKKENQERIQNIRAKADKLLSDMNNSIEKHMKDFV